MTQASPPPLRVVLADAHAVVRDGLPLLLREHDVAVVAATATVAGAAAAVEQMCPDLALVCPNLSDPTDERPLSRLVRGGEETRLALYVDLEAEERLGTAVEHGALGVIAKGRPVPDLARFLHRVAAGRLCVGVQARGSDPAAPAPRSEALTAGERRVLALLAGGASTQAVAQALELSPHTVRTHVKNILRKLDVTSRAHAVAIAVREATIGV